MIQHVDGHKHVSGWLMNLFGLKWRKWKGQGRLPEWHRRVFSIVGTCGAPLLWKCGDIQSTRLIRTNIQARRVILTHWVKKGDSVASRWSHYIVSITVISSSVQQWPTIRISSVALTRRAFSPHNKMAVCATARAASVRLPARRTPSKPTPAFSSKKQIRRKTTN